MKKRKGWMVHWASEPFYHRLARCRTMLYVHGMLTDRESHACAERIEKAYLNSRKKGSAK